jgi:hypothetical protein
MAPVHSGTEKFTLPVTMMHSFSGRPNTVAWLLRVRGDVEGRAETVDDFPITVAPSRVEGAP